MVIKLLATCSENRFPKTLVALLHACYMSRISQPPRSDHPQYYMVDNTNYEAPHYAIFFHSSVTSSRLCPKKGLLGILFYSNLCLCYSLGGEGPSSTLI